MNARSVWLTVGIVIGVTAGAWYFARDERVVAQDPAAPAVPAALPCEADARCVGGRHAAAAALACKAGIEDLAGYRVRWADDAPPRFSRFAWRDRAQGTITFIGDQAEFANASGAFQPVTYECDVDLAQDKVLDARVRQGRLP